MSGEIDRRIAIEVFGEEEPPPSTVNLSAGIRFHSLVLAENWSPCEIWTEDDDFVGYGWRPAPFSSDLEEALRAVRKKRETHPGGLIVMQNEDATMWSVGGFGATEWVESSTLPQAICNLLLDLTDKA